MLATFKTCIARALFIPSLLCLFLAHSPRLPPPAVVLTFRDSDHQIVCRNILHVNSCLGRTSNFVKYLFFPFFFFLQKFLFLIFLDSEAKREDSRFLRFQVLSSPKSRWNVIGCLDIVRFDCSLDGSFQRCVEHDIRIDRNVFSKT